MGNRKKFLRACFATPRQLQYLERMRKGRAELVVVDDGPGRSRVYLAEMGQPWDEVDGKVAAGLLRKIAEGDWFVGSDGGPDGVRRYRLSRLGEELARGSGRLSAAQASRIQEEVESV